MVKNTDNKPYSYPKEATPEQVGEMAKKFEEMRQMSGSDGRYDKPKPKKKVMAPIEIPPIISVPLYEEEFLPSKVASKQIEPIFYLRMTNFEINADKNYCEKNN